MVTNTLKSNADNRQIKSCRLTKTQKSIVIKSVRQMQEIAGYLGKKLYPGIVICLIGELGSGKTTFVQGLARGLGIKRNVLSPSFQLLRVYSGRLDLYHFDLYRLKSAQEWEDLGYNEYFSRQGVSIIEWADKVSSTWPEKRLEIYFQYGQANTRRVTFVAVGPEAKRLLQSS